MRLAEQTATKSRWINPQTDLPLPSNKSQTTGWCVAFLSNTTQNSQTTSPLYPRRHLMAGEGITRNSTRTWLTLKPLTESSLPIRLAQHNRRPVDVSAPILHWTECDRWKNVKTRLYYPVSQLVASSSSKAILCCERTEPGISAVARAWNSSQGWSSSTQPSPGFRDHVLLSTDQGLDSWRRKKQNKNFNRTCSHII